MPVMNVTMKIGNAQQARNNNNYKNTKLKLLEENAAMWLTRYAEQNN
jgi:hypothetical protein